VVLYVVSELKMALFAPQNLADAGMPGILISMVLCSIPNTLVPIIIVSYIHHCPSPDSYTIKEHQS
jgi:hypothetical protein